MVTEVHRRELKALNQIMRRENVRSLLEIGSRQGVSLEYLSLALPLGARIVAVDLPDGAWGKSESSQSLTDLVDRLKAAGNDAHLFLGDSHDPEIVAQVAALGPYDMVFIDADHRYEAVLADWENYGPMGRVVVFDDVLAIGSKRCHGNDLKYGVRKLWSELMHRFPSAVIAATDSEQGKGVLYQPMKRAP